VNQLRRHLSVANVLSGIALFVALSGAAYAAALAPKSVKTKNLANGAVTAKKLHKAAVTTPKIAKEAVIASKIAQGNVGSTQISDAGVRSADLGGGVVTTQKLKDGAVTSSKLDGEAVNTAQIKNGAVTSAKLSPSILSQLVKDVSYVTGSTGSEATPAVKSVTVECTPSAAQKQVIGGGARIIGDNEDIRLIESGPTFKGATAVGWTAAAIDESGTTNPWTLQVHAICAEL
jgi:hypothetical protein